MIWEAQQTHNTATLPSEYSKASGSPLRSGIRANGLAADLPEITADRVQLQQVFMNLMLNAVEEVLGRESGSGFNTVRRATPPSGPRSLPGCDKPRLSNITRVRHDSCHNDACLTLVGWRFLCINRAPEVPFAS